MTTYSPGMDGGAVEMGIIVPPASSIAPTAPATWFAVDRTLASRFSLARSTVARYACFNIGVSAGSIQVSVVRLTSGGATPSYDVVMDSDLIAAPTAGDQRLDLGATLLTPGDYALCFYSSGTTLTVPNVNGAASGSAARWALAKSNTTTAGGTFALGYTSRYMPGFTLECDV